MLAELLSRVFVGEAIILCIVGGLAGQGEPKGVVLGNKLDLGDRKLPSATLGDRIKTLIFTCTRNKS